MSAHTCLHETTLLVLALALCTVPWVSCVVVFLVNIPSVFDGAWKRSKPCTKH